MMIFHKKGSGTKILFSRGARRAEDTVSHGKRTVSGFFEMERPSSARGVRRG